MTTPITCFKAYDIRGELNTQLNEEVAYRIGFAFAEELSAKSVVVGGDVRLTSTPLKLAGSAGKSLGLGKEVSITRFQGEAGIGNSKLRLSL